MPWLCIHHWTNCRLSFRPSERSFSFHCGVGVHRTLYWPNRRLSLRPSGTKTVVGQNPVYHSGLFGQKLTVVPFTRRVPVSAVASLDKRPSITPRVSAKNLSPGAPPDSGQRVIKPSIPAAATVQRSGPAVYHVVRGRLSIRPDRLSLPILCLNRFGQFGFQDLKLSF